MAVLSVHNIPSVSATARSSQRQH